MKILEFITGNQGIFGAVFGSVATLITTHLLKSIGRVKVELLDIKISFSKDDDLGGTEPAKDISEAKYVSIEFNVKCYNSTDTPRVLDNIEFICYSDTKEPILKGRLNDNSTHKFAAAQHRYDKLFFINIPAKEGVVKSTNISFSSNDSQKMRDIKYIKLVYKDKRNKSKVIAKY